MRRYRRKSVENWGWPLLFFTEKPLFPPISHKKAAVKFLNTDAEKSVPNRKTRFPQKEKKTLECLLFQNGGCRTPKSLPRKVCENSGKIIQNHSYKKINFRFYHLQLYLREWRIFDNYIYFFFSLYQQVLSFQTYWVFFMTFHIGIGLFRFHLGVIFVISWFFLAVLGAVWRPPFRRRLFQMSHEATITWEF